MRALLCLLLTVAFISGCAKQQPTTTESDDFMLAVRQGNVEDVKLMLDRFNNSALVNRDYALVEGGVKHKPIQWVLIFYGGSAEMVKILLDHGAHAEDVILPDVAHSYFVADNDAGADVVKLLLDRGVDPNQVDERGLTALGLIMEELPGYEHQRILDMMRVLLEHGADPNVRSYGIYSDDGGQYSDTPLKAVRKERRKYSTRPELDEMESLLVKHGAKDGIIRNGQLQSDE